MDSSISPLTPSTAQALRSAMSATRMAIGTAFRLPTTDRLRNMPPNSSNNTEVVGITDSGEIYGDYTDWTNVQHGFVASVGVTTTIDVPFATTTDISGATASGELFGSYVGFNLG
jgi:hypothetical protein